MPQLPYLNLGCGRVILPAPKPAHYGLLDPIEGYALWHNVDRNQQPGVDEVVDVFKFPYPWKDNSFDGALLAHLAEHCPHEIRPSNLAQFDTAQWHQLSQMQDGWYAMFSELHRVLTPGSIIHILSPYAWSHGAIVDPTHTRYLMPESFMHSMTPNPDAPFAYATGGLHLEMVEGARFNVTDSYQHLANQQQLLWQAVSSNINVVYEFSVKLRVVK